MTDEDSQLRIGGLVLAHLPQGVITTDAQQRVTAVNPAAEAIYGFRADEAIGLRISEIVEQLQLDGSAFDVASLRASRADDWHGRVVTRPLIGARKGTNIVVDLALTALSDRDGQAVGYMGVVKPVSHSAQLTSDAAMLGDLAVALSRARGFSEVANASVDHVAKGTLSDLVAIVLDTDKGRRVGASLGFSDTFVRALETITVPGLVQARSAPGVILSLEQVLALLEGTPGETAVKAEGIAAGCLVNLRVRDEVVGTLLLGSRRANWSCPPDGVILQAATQIANALENARYLEEERRVTAQLEAMISLMRLPVVRSSEVAIAEGLLGRMVEVLGADGGLVIRDDGGTVRVLASMTDPMGMMPRLMGRPIESLYFWQGLVERGGGAFLLSLRELGRTVPGVLRMAEAGLESQAIFPLKQDDSLVGAFVCNFHAGSDRTPILDERSLDAFARVISIAYSNVRLNERLAESADRESRLAAEVSALQELTLLGARTDDLETLARETIEKVVTASSAAGGGYFLIDEDSAKIAEVCWVGVASTHWPDGSATVQRADWPALAQLRQGDGGWLSGRESGSSCDYEAVLPLRVENKLLGFLHLEWTDVPDATEFDLHFLEPIARVCSISLANFRLRAELVRGANEQHALNLRLATLDELTRVGEQAGSFEELAHRTVSLVKDALGASGVCYLLMEPGHHFETHAVAGETGAFRLWLKGVPARDAPGGRQLIAGNSSVLADFVAGHVNERVLPLARATGFASFGAIPIQTGEELAGALLCFFKEPVAELPVTETALDSVARIAGIALANYRLRDSLSSSEERYRTLFAQTPDALFVTALDGTVLDANEAAVRTYRVNRGEMLGRYIGLLISADEREMARRRQIVWAQGRGTFRDRGRRHDGSEFPVTVEIRVVELDGQRRFLHLIRDTSDEERLTGELLQAQKMEAIGSLVAGVAHELNNPLTGIIGFGALLRTDPRLPEDMRHNAELLVVEAERTRRIVQNLLDFARARKPERRPTKLATLVGSVLELQSYAFNDNLVYEVNIPDSVPEIDLDRAQMQQVFLNLTINAIQAMRSDVAHRPHHLWVSAEALDATSSRSDRAPDNQRVRIVVRDDGPGVPEANRVHLFDPFFTTKEPGEGTGLGLSVSFGIVAAHGGHLYFAPSPDGVGSCFIIEMPVKAIAGADDQPSFTQIDAMTALTERAVPRIAINGHGNGNGSERPHEGRPDHPATAREDDDRTPRSRAHPHAHAADAGSLVRAMAPEGRLAAEADEPAEAGASTDPPRADNPPPADGTPQADDPAAAERPASEPPRVSGSAAAEPAADAAPAVKPRVLILDDEPVIRELLRRSLIAAGMDPQPYADGAQALDGVQQMSFDAMLIDHKMAGMTGTEFLELAVQMRAELANRAIFMSGDVLNPDLANFARTRGIRLIQKPFDYPHVIACIREMLAARPGGS